jgi:hypothetical protein
VRSCPARPTSTPWARGGRALDRRSPALGAVDELSVVVMGRGHLHSLVGDRVLLSEAEQARKFDAIVRTHEVAVLSGINEFVGGEAIASDFFRWSVIECTSLRIRAMTSSPMLTNPPKRSVLHLHGWGGLSGCLFRRFIQELANTLCGRPSCRGYSSLPRSDAP